MLPTGYAYYGLTVHILSFIVVLEAEKMGMYERNKAVRSCNNRIACLVGTVITMIALLARADAQRVPIFEQSPIRYSKTAAENVVTRLQMKLKVEQPSFISTKELLKYVLKELKVPIASHFFHHRAVFFGCFNFVNVHLCNMFLHF